MLLRATIADDVAYLGAENYGNATNTVVESGIGTEYDVATIVIEGRLECTSSIFEGMGYDCI